MSRIIHPEVARSVNRFQSERDRMLRAPQAYGVGGVNGRSARQYGVGGCAPRQLTGCDAVGNSSIDRAFCFKGGKRLCDLAKVSNSVSVAGGSAFTLNLQPTLSVYFEPIAVRMVVTDASNSNLNYRAFITSISINQMPQEAINDSAPTVATTAGYWSDDYTDPDNYAIPVGWGVFGKTTLNEQLQMVGFTRGYAAGVTLWITLTCYGNPMGSLPQGCQCGQPLPECPSGSGGGSGSGTPYSGGVRPQ